ncbi:MAG TPA: glycerol-3-phosphate 1-O-acyltransferase PlsY [Burkholderiales bacterium]|nr:glycerol-3-phosphate 1-O-acyltransferase PlsY [Burkholderiales bacterium]
MATIVFIAIAYLIGSISFAVLTSRLFNMPDPRTYGSKNPGATNVLRSGKKAVAALTLLGDAAKGWLAVYLAQQFAPQYGLGGEAIIAVAVAVIAGHSYSIFLRFHGGKGVATTGGVLFAINLLLGLSALATWLVVAFITRVSSLAALITAVLAPFYALYIFGWDSRSLAVLVICLFLIWRHQSNIRRLIAGTEEKLEKRESP